MTTAGYPDDDSGLFAASYAKLLRAKQFIAELKAEAEDYKASRPLTITAVNPNGSILFRWASISLKPSAIVGDAIHNLRATLDLMASELARRNGESDKGVYFPFAESPAEYDAAIKSKKFTRTGVDSVALLKTFQPYNGGNAALRALHDLDVRDKHKALTLSGSNMHVQVQGAYDIDEIMSGQFEIELTQMDYIFADGPFEDAKVVEQLEALVSLVETILEAFKRMIEFRSGGPTLS